MDMNLNKENINYLKMIYSTAFAHEETTELIVPDAQPDILEILDSDATVLLRSKEADNGRVIISGMVNATVLYIPEDNSGIKKLELGIPFSAAAEHGEIGAENRIIASVSLSSIDSRTINPRKIMVRADVLVSVSCYADAELNIVNSVAENEDVTVEALNKKCVISPITDVAEKTFIITDEFMLPGSKPQMGEILKVGTHLMPDEIKCVGQKLIFKGLLYVDLTYRSANGDDVVSAQFSTAFSQIMELEMSGEDNIFNLCLAPTGIYCTPILHNTSEESGISIELHAVAQCSVSTKQEITYICDAYSSKYEIQTKDERVEIKGIESCATFAETLRESITVPGGVKKIICSSVSSGMVSCVAAGNKAEFKVPLNVSVVYLTDSEKICSEIYRFNVSTETEAEACCTYNAKVIVGKDFYVTPSADGIDIRFPVCFALEKVSVQQFDMIASISCDKNAVIDLSDKPSVIVHRIVTGETLWAIAKRYCSTAESICASNGIENESAFTEGTVILIPKIR